jgi:hypothetical protein
LPNAFSLPARNADASQYGVNAIELKGHYIERFASCFEAVSDDQPLSADEIWSVCTDSNGSQSDLDSF